MKRAMNVLALQKGEEQYVFFFDDHSFIEVQLTFGRYAADERLSFTWYDAAILSLQLRQMRDKHKERNQ